MYKLSKSQISGKEYTIPSSLDDISTINNFIDFNKDKKIIVVQGLGFVGAVMSVVCANTPNNEYAVIGVDLPSEDSFWKIASINDGVFPIISSDKKVEEFYQSAMSKKNFYATYDSYAYSVADSIIVDINLDVQKNATEMNDLIDFDVSMSGFYSAIKAIGKNCKKDALILIETTVPPGSTQVAMQLIYDEFSNRNISTSELKIGHSYERVMPGPNYIDSIQNFYRVYSGVNDYSADHIENFLKTIIKTDEYPLSRLKSTNATEISKVLENSYRAMNISFIVEWSRYAEEAGVDLYEVVKAIRMRPTHSNMMLPGIGVGGYCLTKDPLLASWSRQNLIKGKGKLSCSENAVAINDKMPEYAFNFLESFFPNNSLMHKKIMMLGVSYAPDIGDTRYTPVELLYKKLKNIDCIIDLHDPYIPFWEEMGINVNTEIKLIENSVDVIIFSTGHSIYRNNRDLVNSILNLENIFIFDTIGVLSQFEIQELRKKHIVKILGRGDI